MSERPVRTSAALRRAFRIAPDLRHGLILTLLLALAGTGLQIVVPIVLQQVIDNEILGSTAVDTADVTQKGLIALGAVLVAMGARYLSLRRLVISSASGLAQLRVVTFRHLHRMSLLDLQSERRGALVARVTSDIETMQAFMEWGGMGMILGLSQVVLGVVVMAVYSWQLTLVVMVGVGIYTLLIVYFQRILGRAHDRVRERVSDSLAVTGEAISGLQTVRAYGMEDVVKDRVDETLDRQFSAEVRAAIVASSLFSSAELFAGILTAVVIGAGVVFGDEWGLSAGGLVAFLFLVNLLIDPIQRLVESLDQAQSAGAGLRKILGVVDTPVSIPDPIDSVELPDRSLGVRFDHVSFAYPGGPDVLRGVSLEIPPGQRVAVIGETGSGKTTFAKLATRLLSPSSGSIEIGGLPVDRVSFASLRSHVSYVPQEGFLFDGTIANNVRYGRPGVSDAEVTAAFGDLGLADWIGSLPEGIRTPVGERGSSLSAGERQLVAITRAWIADPKLLVLDEATSAVDPALEVQIRTAIEQLTQGRTSITIAHRLSTAEASERILVFDGGVVAEDGSHSDLLELRGVYASLHADWEGATSAT
ncbi:MAG: ABC transporter ATP-binding protein [Deltaproteobacteria bacterium]|jgi:putative ABC transport system ATP-binding protein|nr:ABC transporter ATP-binding protein [Deltaproteobacteria bacterium]